MQVPLPIDVMSTAPTPSQEQIEAKAGAILSGGYGDPFGHMVMPDRGMFNFDDGTVWLYRLSPQTCTRLFNAAQQTDAFLNIGIGDFAPLEIKGSRAKAWSVSRKPVFISSSAELCIALRKDMDWRPVVKPDPFANYVSEDDPHPSMDPGAEARKVRDTSGVAAQCESLTRKEFDHSGYTVIRWLTTQSPRWGTIWRADIALTHNVGTSVAGIFGKIRSLHLRLTCWRDRSTGKLARAKRPLEALEELEALKDMTALAPLAGADVINRQP